jgi:hypothetical protein
MGIKQQTTGRLTTTDVENPVVIAGPYSYYGATLSPNPDTSYALGSAVVTVQYSADGENFFNSAKTLSNSTQSFFNEEIRGVHSLRFVTTTADGSADPDAVISVYLQ